MSYLMKILRSIFLLLFIPVTLSLTADKVSTTRKHLRLSPAISCPRDSAVLLADTIPHPVGVLRFCGYEKSLRAPRETIFIENLSDSSTIEKINFTIDYFDTSARLIHSRTLWQTIEIPPHQARRIDIPTWDIQRTYYYLRGPRPRKSATPYDVTIRPDTVIIR